AQKTTFRLTEFNIVHSRIHTASRDVRVRCEIGSAIEPGVRHPVLSRAMHHVVARSRFSGGGHIRVTLQVPISVDESGAIQNSHVVAYAAPLPHCMHQALKRTTQPNRDVLDPLRASGPRPLADDRTAPDCKDYAVNQPRGKADHIAPTQPPARFSELGPSS